MWEVCQHAVCVWEMDFEYLDHKRLLGGVMPDNTVTKVITHDKFSLNREERSHRCWGKETFFLFWFWDGKPVVSSGKFGSSENQPIQTDCLWNLWVNVEAENSKILVASCSSLLVISCLILGFTFLIVYFFLSKYTCILKIIESEL